ncbi:protein MIZU-KUSSEI 1-like [Typha angustifolia]|uniref:protein MIZU-KUSSEI 1-like n=1 Tax=Typha angustifolia TaxID=59011 RepID=UPI003C2AD761
MSFPPPSPRNPSAAAVPELPPASPRTPRTPRPPITLTEPSKTKRPAKSSKALRALRSLFRTFPILTPACSFHAGLPRGGRPHDGHVHGASRTTGTLFGHRKARITLAIQENPGSVPVLLLELAMQTGKFMQEMGSEHLRIALECEKKANDKVRLLDEPLWTAYVNGRKIGYAVKREATEDDLTVMQLLHTVSVGAGVLPSDIVEPAEGDLAYMRAHFDRVVGSKDSESFYMLNPDGNNGPELSIFFIRI